MKTTCKNIKEVLQRNGIYAKVFKSGSDVMLDLEGHPQAGLVQKVLEFEGFSTWYTSRLTPDLKVVTKQMRLL
jgi:hypothetical protein